MTDKKKKDRIMVPLWVFFIVEALVFVLGLYMGDYLGGFSLDFWADVELNTE